MRRSAALNALVLVSVIDCVFAKGLPSSLHLCKRRDPNLEKCLLENVEILQPSFKKGIAELFIPPLDPLVIPEATLNAGDSFKASFKNIELYHADRFKIENFKMDLDKYTVLIKVKFPELRIKSTYNINGRLLVLSLNGQGPADGNYTNVEGTLNLKGTPVEKNNKNYVTWEKEKIDLNIEKMHLYFEKLFGDNEELNAQTNKVINENIDDIVAELKPVILEVVSNFIFSLLNRLFGRYSLDELFISS